MVLMGYLWPPSQREAASSVSFSNFRPFSLSPSQQSGQNREAELLFDTHFLVFRSDGNRIFSYPYVLIFFFFTLLRF